MTDGEDKSGIGAMPRRFPRIHFSPSARPILLGPYPFCRPATRAAFADAKPDQKRKNVQAKGVIRFYRHNELLAIFAQVCELFCIYE